MAGELRFWSWRNEDKAAYAEFFKEFNKQHPDVKITFEAFEPQNYPTVLSTAMAGDKGPDMMMVRAYGAFEAIARPGYLLELNEGNVPGLTKLPEPALKGQTLRADGKIYAVPFATQTMLIIYNTEIFNRVGVKPPETWDELVEVCKKLKAAGVIPFANGTATAWQNETLVSALLSSQFGKQFEATSSPARPISPTSASSRRSAACRTSPRPIISRRASRASTTRPRSSSSPRARRRCSRAAPSSSRRS